MMAHTIMVNMEDGSNGGPNGDGDNKPYSYGHHFAEAAVDCKLAGWRPCPGPAFWLRSLSPLPTSSARPPGRSFSALHLRLRADEVPSQV